MSCYTAPSIGIAASRRSSTPANRYALGRIPKRYRPLDGDSRRAHTSAMTIRRLVLTTGAVFLAAFPILTGVMAAQTSPTLITLYNFTGGSDGLDPFSGLVIGGGVLYGTTYTQGSSDFAGTVFSVAPPTSAGAPWTLTTIANLGNGNSGYPVGGVAIGSGGVLYGTTNEGGADSDGTVFSVTPPAAAGGAWSQTLLWSFPNVGGYQPTAGVVIDQSGVLYGTTYCGSPGYGAKSPGTVFRLAPPATPGGAWTFNTLHNFGGPMDGSGPYAGVVGYYSALYGTTSTGGTAGGGIVFSLTPPASPGSPWIETVLHNFTGYPNGGATPAAAVLIGTGGVLYSTTSGGGASKSGTVYSLTPPASPGGAWTEAVLYNFAGGSDGANPRLIPTRL